MSSAALTDGASDDIVDRFDAVVGTYGGCGSCTAWSPVRRRWSIGSASRGLMIAAENFARQVSFLSRVGRSTLQCKSTHGTSGLA